MVSIVIAKVKVKVRLMIISRYVPKPKPGVFRITKTIHNTLQVCFARI